MTILHCAICFAGYRSAGAVPETCPTCGKSTRWTTSPHVADPVVPYALSWMDKKLLRSFRISQDEPEA